MASIPGFKTNITIKEFANNIEKIGISIASQELNLAPVENKFYRLRNEITCRDSIVLIAISLMSLKIATGSTKIVFDLSCGNGTYLKNKEEARKLGKLLVKMGKTLNKQVGNILEIQETIRCLNGKMPRDVEETVVMLRKYSFIFSIWWKRFRNKYSKN